VTPLDQRCLRSTAIAAITAGCALAAACGGGGTPAPVPPPPPASGDGIAQTSASSPFAANCDGVPAIGSLYSNAEVEPSLAVNPINAANLVGAWQQDRWSNGGAHGVLLGISQDGGHTWSTAMVPFSRCTGGDAVNGGDFERATDPWTSFSPSGIAYALALVFSGQTLAPGSTSAMRAARSLDGGVSWSPPRTLIVDGDQFFNDKGSITADPTDPRYVYAVWDRLTNANHSTTTFVRSIDGGSTWEPARAIYDPGASNQTIGNIIVVLPDGTLENVFTEFDAAPAAPASLRAIRSTNRGVTWSAPIQIADELAIGAHDPNTGAAIRDGSNLPSVTVDTAGVMYVVWQDARFSAGLRDGIAISRSTDGGLNWTAPVQINAAPATQAFVPVVQVRADGVVGVTYFDFRNNTSDNRTLLTDYWMVSSSNAAAWTESHVTGPFDLDLAPQAGGLFLGDYQSLGSAGTTFLPFFAKTNSGDSANRTDIFIAFSPTAGRPAAASVHVASAGPSRAPLLNADWQRRVDDNIGRVRRARYVGQPL
jgi:hypothetical protein